MGDYLMTFIDTPYRFAVKATCTNRKCNLSVFGGPASGFEKNVWAHVIDHPEHGGVCLTTFIRISNCLAVFSK